MLMKRFSNLEQESRKRHRLHKFKVTLHAIKTCYANYELKKLVSHKTWIGLSYKNFQRSHVETI